MRCESESSTHGSESDEEGVGLLDVDLLEKGGAQRQREPLLRGGTANLRPTRIWQVLALLSPLSVGVILLNRHSATAPSPHRPGWHNDGPGVEQEPVESWTPEEQRWRNFSWSAVPHESLERIKSSLSENDLRTASVLHSLRTQASQGTAIGISQSFPPERIRSHVADAESQLGNIPLPAFEGGSPSKYADLLFEWETGRPAQSCPKGLWEDEVRERQAKMLAGEIPPRLLDFHCHREPDKFLEGCDGLGGRMLGITTLFLYSILTGRAFSVVWEWPLPFELLFDSPNIDWSRPITPEASHHRLYLDKTLVAQKHKASLILILKVTPLRDLLKMLRGPEAWWSLLVKTAGVITSFDDPVVAPLLLEKGLRRDTAWRCLVDYLVRPKPAALDFIHQYSSIFSLPSVYSIGIQIRTGDESMATAQGDVVNSIVNHRVFFDCARQVAATRALAGQKVIYYLLTDSNHLKHAALQEFPDTVLVSGRTSKHMDSAEAEEVLDIVAESWVFPHTDFQIISGFSSFGKIPALMRGRPGSTIQIAFADRYRDEESTTLDCSSEAALTSYTQMSQEWTGA